MQAVYFDGTNGEKVRREAIPADMQEDAKKYRHPMLESLSMYSDELMELLLGEADVPEELIHAVGERCRAKPGCHAGVHGLGLQEQRRAAAVGRDRALFAFAAAQESRAKKWENPDEKIPLTADPTKPFVGMAFKLVDDPYGQLTFMRIYQGTVNKGDQMVNQRTSQQQRFSRIVRMHADKREEMDSATAGDIVAVIGVDAASGDTYAAEP